MKRFICACIAFIILFSCVSYYESTYTRKAKITNIEKTTITATDKKGNIWQFKGKGFKRGQKIILVMDTNNTDENITDDIIKGIR